jgi:CHAT domain-containing protein
MNSRAFVFSTLLAALVAAIVVAPASAQPKRTGKSAATAPCRAAMGDLQGFKEALLQHDLAYQGFRTKFKTGYYAEAGSLNKDLAKQTPADLVARTSKAIETTADAGAGLLMYALTRRPGGGDLLCVWLLGSNGLLAAETSGALPAPSVAFLARASLRVESRAAARRPVPRKASPAGVQPKNQVVEPAEAPSMQQLAAVLLPGTIKQKLEEARFSRLLVLPAADLGTVPWPALPLGDGQIVDQSAVVVLADIDWIMKEQEQVNLRDAAAFVVGDPDLGGDPALVFSPIPASRSEAVAVASKWSASTAPLIGERADRTAVMAALNGRTDQLGLVYFATHGISDEVNPMDGSFLALKDGHLYARDIKKLVLAGRPMVVMSACQTGLGKTFDAGVFGLARAWWQAGSPQVVMSLWNVDDAATNDLMTDFVGRVVADRPARNAGKPTLAHEEALRQAMLASRQRNADPALWASFALFGMPTPPVGERPIRRRSVGP